MQSKDFVQESSMLEVIMCYRQLSACVHEGILGLFVKYKQLD